MSRAVATILTAVLVVLAGCGGMPGGGGTATPSETQTGTVNFYISDQQNAIDDFEHLNVTITKVGFHRANESSDENQTAGWVDRDVDSVTVDLTELQGENASQLGALSVPNATYDKVFVYISDINGTLKSGEQANVKLPSERLHINKEFTVGSGEEISFVFDVAVHKAGKDGKYIIKPVVGQSGTDVPIKEKPSAKKGQGKKGGKQKGESGNRTTEGQGSVDFYVSDERNAIEDFRYLNVTITKVGLHKADESGGNETASGNETKNESESKEKRAGWVEKDVDNATVDLTELQGANASQITELSAPAGTYDKVFVYISDINATLDSGKQVNVKLPSKKLHINKKFAVNASEDVDFVYDVTVKKAGKSGKYILRPVVSQSGTSKEVEIKEKGKKKEGGEEGKEQQAALNASFTTNVTAGENATLKVTQNDSAVANATVEVNGEAVGQTAADGTITFMVPSDAEELEVKVTKGDLEAELTRDLSTNETSGNQTSQSYTTAPLTG